MKAAQILENFSEIFLSIFLISVLVNGSYDLSLNGKLSGRDITWFMLELAFKLAIAAALVTSSRKFLILMNEM